MNEPNAEAAESGVRFIAPSKRLWVLPILRALEQMDGSGRPKVVAEKVMDLFSQGLNEKQLIQLRDHAGLGWTRLEMVKCGLLGGERALWSLTPLSRVYLRAHRNDVLDPPRHFLSNSSDAVEVTTEIVSVTETRAYEIPILSVVRKGRMMRHEILARVYHHLKDRLLPGDTRTVPDKKVMVALERAGSALSGMWRDGRVRNPVRGYWEITDRGRESLELGEAFFSLAQYQGATRAMVLISSGHSGKSTFTPNLQTLKTILGTTLFGELQECLQFNRGPSPVNPLGLSRNLIFYGPPGTGKTRLAKLVAQSLAEDEHPGPESRWRILSFHPGYAYGDFIQNLEPSQESQSLTYRISTGSFLEFCAQADAEPDRFFVMVIDELHRGEASRIFGELAYAMEYRGEEVELARGGILRVPTNLVILATVSSADAHAFPLDSALRRRFSFLRIPPDPEIISELLVGNAELMAGTLELFNEWVEQTLDEDHTIGHSYFLNPSLHPFTAITMERAWRTEILPLMEHYFLRNRELIAESRIAWKRAIKSAAKKLHTAQAGA